MSEEDALQKQPLMEAEAVSWWSWRPGMRPGRAFVFGGLLSLMALFLLANGVTTLVADILDSSAIPVRVPGVVTGHGKDVLGAPQLTLHLEQAGFPTTITLVVAPTTATALANGSAVIVDYAPHRRIAYALESRGQRYLLPGTSATGNLWQSLGLLLSGLLLLPYPLLLSFWGWRDLRSGQTCRRTARVVALRAARQTTTRAPGLVPRTTHIWHGVALQMDDSSANTPEILTFGISQEQHAQLKRGERVEVLYTPHLHRLYALKSLP